MFYPHLAGCTRSPAGETAKHIPKHLGLGSRKWGNLCRLCQDYGTRNRALPKAAKKWCDRQGFTADRVRSLAILNGRQDIDPHDMSLILTQYSSWLLGRLAVAQNRSMQGANAGNNPGFDPGTDPYVKTAHFIGETCTKTYREADLSAQRRRCQTRIGSNATAIPPKGYGSMALHNAGHS